MLGFRVWDVEERKFLTRFEKDCCMTMAGEVYVAHDEDNSEWLDDPDLYIPTQSTGLIDDNKNTIFVGDIIEYKYMSHEGVIKHGLLLIDELPYGISDLFSFPDNGIIDRWYRVIGNSFEHPELLEKIK